MSITRVRAEAMNAGIAALAKAAQQLDTELDSLRNDLNSRLGTWEGDSRKQYDDVQLRWNNQATQNALQIQNTKTALDKITMKYISNEKRVASRWV